MSLLVTAVFLLMLLWGDMHAPTEDVDALSSAMQVALITFLVPAFAAIQMFFGRMRHRKELPGHWVNRFRSMVVAHTLVWAIISLTVVIAMRWSSVVRLVPNASSIPLLDDILLIAPALLSLISSWAIFVYAAPEKTLSIKKSPTEVLSLWLRMRILMVLLPMLFAFFVTDCFKLASQVDLSPGGITTVAILAITAIIALIVFYPQLLMLVWKTKPLTDGTTRTRIDKLFAAAKLRPRSIHVWQTGRSVANAAAVGIVPGTEVIVLSDMMLEKFSVEEIDAIVLHEIGHIKLCHCLKRIAMVLAPLFLLAADQSTGQGLHALIANSSLLNDLFGALTKFLPAILFLVYLLIASMWIFRKMEFEADQFAIEILDRFGAGNSITAALEKLAVIYPHLINRRSGLHPSIRERLAFAIQHEATLAGNESVENTATTAPPETISLDPAAAK